MASEVIFRYPRIIIESFPHDITKKVCAIYLCMYMSIYVYIYMYVYIWYVYIYMYIYIYDMCIYIYIIIITIKYHYHYHYCYYYYHYYCHYCYYHRYSIWKSSVQTSLPGRRRRLPQGARERGVGLEVCLLQHLSSWGHWPVTVESPTVISSFHLMVV